MNRKELTFRLADLGRKKEWFANELGVSLLTVYQWELVPQYAVKCLELMEEVQRLKGGRK